MHFSFLKVICDNSIKLNKLRNFPVVKSHRFYSILFFGTDNFSLPTLKLLSKQNELISRLEVVTSFKSKKNPVKDYANEKKLLLHDWKSIKQNHDFCSEFDIGLVVSFGYLIPEQMINNFKHGMLNVHASLLPQYRGASPIIYAIKNHEQKTGVSIMKIKPNKFDIGEILAKQEVEISDHILMNELLINLANVGAEILVECLGNLDNIKPIEQNEKLASYAPKINNDFTKVRWNEMKAIEVYDLYRSLYSYKHLTTTFRNEPVKLVELKLGNSSAENHEAGRIKFCRKKKQLIVYGIDGKCVEISRLSIGKKVMTAIDFNNGFLKNVKESEMIFE